MFVSIKLALMSLIRLEAYLCHCNIFPYMTQLCSLFPQESLTQCFESLPSSYKVAPLAAPGQPPAFASPVTSTAVRVTSWEPSGPAGDWISVIRRGVRKTGAPNAATDGGSKRKGHSVLTDVLKIETPVLF